MIEDAFDLVLAIIRGLRQVHQDDYRDTEYNLGYMAALEEVEEAMDDYLWRKGG